MAESYNCQAVRAYKHVALTATHFLPALFTGPETEKDRVVHAAFAAWAVFDIVGVLDTLHTANDFSPCVDVSEWTAGECFSAWQLPVFYDEFRLVGLLIIDPDFQILDNPLVFVVRNWNEMFVFDV